MTTIGNSAFNNCTSLTSAVLPNALTLIGSDVFYNCSSLTNISIPNTVSTIDESTFYGCSSLTSITIPNSVTTIGGAEFKGCSNLTSITIPNSVTAIGNAAFESCSSLTSITIPNSVTTIGNNAFKNCPNLASVTLHCNVISTWFKGLPKLKEVIIGEEVTKIDNSAFSNCSAISTIEIGKGIKEIGERAFAGINKLTDVYCYAEEVPNTDRTAFENSYLDYVTLHVPYPSIETYKSVGPWKYFKEILTLPKDTYTLTFVVDGQVYKTLELLPGATITPEVEPTKEGYTFSGWSDISETMPAQDVTITGTFTINKYNLNYIVDGENYKSSEIEYDATITPEAAPTKEGYTFSGWSEIPETMPAYDVTVTGSFTINSYKLTYIVDGEEYKSIEVEYNTSITPETDPTKDGYDFSGWSEIPETMPAYDVTITGSFERRYDVGNVTSLISFILRGNGGSDDLAIYDMNGDGVLDIGDLILVVRKVLNSTTRSAATRANVDCLTPDLTQYSAAQFVLNAPESVREQDIRLAGGIEQTHQIMCKQIEPGAYAVVVYSLTNSLFTPVDGGIIEVNDGKAHSGDLYIQDVLLAKPTGETKRYDNMPVATKISDIEKENGHGQVYDLKGQKQNRTDGLQKGVYIENGKKIVVR